MHLPIDEGRWINWEDIKISVKGNFELMLIKTGFCDRRKEREYWENNPGLNSDLGLLLRRRFPCLKAVGFDFISVSRWQDRDEGRKAHKAFLDPEGEGLPILIIEDMDLSQLSESQELSSVLVVPLRTADSNGAPVTVIADILEA